MVSQHPRPHDPRAAGCRIGEKKSISVLARVVRVDEGGIGHEFVTTEVLKNLRARDFLPQQGTNRRELEKFLAAPK